MRRTLFLILIALSPLVAEAQTLVQKADSLLDLHYNRITYDTAYILRPERRWTFSTLQELGKEREWKTRFPEVVIVSRGAAIRSFGNWFAGITMQYVWERTGNSAAVELRNARWHFMGILGIRL